MNNSAKLILSKEEWLTIKNTDFFRYKKEITEKVYNTFAGIVSHANTLQVFEGLSLPKGTDVSTGKISKGENYSGLPYIILDFPRKFSNEDVFAIRTMLWWGNFVSCTLVLTGNSADNYRSGIKAKYALLKKSKAFVCIHESAWHHHFKSDNYILVSKLTKNQFEKQITSHPFIKIALKLPVSQLEKMESFAIKSFTLYKEVLSD